MFTLLQLLALAFCLEDVRAADTSSQEAAWEKIRESDGITVYRRDIPGSPIVAFKGEAVIDAPLPRVTGVFEEVEREKEWMADVEESFTLEKTSENERWEYNRTHVPWPLRDRDFVVHVFLKFEAAPVPTITISMNSGAHPKKPPVDGVVRGQLIDSSFVLKAVGPDKTWFSCEILADPKGSIPKWVVNLVQKSWPSDTIEGLRKQTRKPDIRENARARRLMQEAGI